MGHHNLIRQYEGVVPDSVCDWLVGSLEGSDGLVHRNLGPQDFYELNLNQTHPDVVPGCVALLQEALKRYTQDFPLETEYFPSDLGLEEFRVKRYTGGTGQQFGDHVDVGDLASSKRYLAFLFYLNDDFEGGNTIFHPATAITPVRGSVVIFPPMWMYPHRGSPVVSGNKYIMSSYLNFI